MGKKILIFTDTTSDQINGVTRCIDHLSADTPEDVVIDVVSADDFVNVPFTGYKEIRLSLAFPQKIYKIIKTIKPDALHIATEGPIGLITAAVCKFYKIPYTTTFHTKFPEYLNMRNRLVRQDYVHRYLHFIHDGAKKIFISHKGMVPYLEENKYEKYAIVPLGIDHKIFFPGEKTLFHDKKSPILLFVGRIAIEKNIEDFLKISNTYTKIVVGDGPQKEEFQEKYPDVIFLGIKKGNELANIYRSIDIFVFPSKTDTLGLVNLEAMACGKPVIAYDLDTMRGIIDDGFNGILIPEGTSLAGGIERALVIQSENTIQFAQAYHWKNYVQAFLDNQVYISTEKWT